MSFNPKVSNIGGSGRHEVIDYVPPSTAVKAGDVVLINSIAYFSVSDIAVGALGALVVAGGKWRGNKASGAWTNGNTVYWHATGSPNVGTASSGAFDQVSSGGTAVGVAVMSPDTGVAAASGDQFGYFVKLPALPSGIS